MWSRYLSTIRSLTSFLGSACLWISNLEWHSSHSFEWLIAIQRRRHFSWTYFMLPSQRQGAISWPWDFSPVTLKGSLESWQIRQILGLPVPCNIRFDGGGLVEVSEGDDDCNASRSFDDAWFSSSVLTFYRMNCRFVNKHHISMICYLQISSFNIQHLDSFPLKVSWSWAKRKSLATLSVALWYTLAWSTTPSRQRKRFPWNFILLSFHYTEQCVIKYRKSKAQGFLKL